MKTKWQVTCHQILHFSFYFINLEKLHILYPDYNREGEMEGPSIIHKNANHAAKQYLSGWIEGKSCKNITRMWRLVHTNIWGHLILCKIAVFCRKARSYSSKLKLKFPVERREVRCILVVSANFIIIRDFILWKITNQSQKNAFWNVNMLKSHKKNPKSLFIMNVQTEKNRRFVMFKL